MNDRARDMIMRIVAAVLCVIHGDASIGNVYANPTEISSDRSRGFARGPRESNLIRTALVNDRIGWRTPKE